MCTRQGCVRHATLVSSAYIVYICFCLAALYTLFLCIHLCACMRCRNGFEFLTVWALSLGLDTKEDNVIFSYHNITVPLARLMQ